MLAMRRLWDREVVGMLVNLTSSKSGAREEAHEKRHTRSGAREVAQKQNDVPVQ